VHVGGPESSVATYVIVAVLPLTVEPFTGEVITTDGGVMSRVTATDAVAKLPSGVVQVTVMVFRPSASETVESFARLHVIALPSWTLTT
jgi:hypothetical protein